MTSSPFRLRLSPLPPGYVYGMRQPSVSVTLQLTGLSVFAVEPAQETLSEVFLISAEEITPLRYLAEQNRMPVLDPLMQHAFALTRHLLGEGGVPAFETEVIHRVVPLGGTSDNYEVYFRAPAIDHLPRNHFAAAYFHALSILWHFTGGEVDQAAFKSQCDALLKRYVGPLRSALNRGLSSLPVLREAYNRQVPITHLGEGMFQLGTGCHGRLISRSATDRDPAIAANIAGKKDLSHAIFRDIGVPVADCVRVQNRDEAIRAARKLGFPVVVKPSDQERSTGVHLELQGDQAVGDAYDAARELSARILVQRHVAGHCARLVTFQGQFVFGYTRHPAGVEGDGSRSIRALVTAFNEAFHRKARHLRSKPLPFDDAALACLSEQGLHPDDVLEAGQLAFLRRFNLPDYAAHNEIITKTVHPENAALAERLSRALRLESAGIDLISTDPTRPWFETGAVVTEINFQPQIGENTARTNLAAMFPEDAPTTIPIDCFVGGKAALQAARAHLAALDTTAMLTSHNLTLDAEGKTYPLAGRNDVFARSVALLRDPAVERLVVVVQTDALLRTGTPFPGNVTVTRVDSNVRSQAKPNGRISADTLTLLIETLEGR